MNLDYNQLVGLATQYGVPLAKALAILAIGWVIAKVLAGASKRLLDKTDLDNKIANYLSGGRAAGAMVEAGVARFVYWLVMLLVLMAVFESLGLTIVTEPIRTLVDKIAGFVPQLMAGGALIAIAWAAATVLRMVVKNLLGAFQVDARLSEQVGGDEGKVSLAGTLADGVYYLIFLLFLPQILDALQMEGLSPVRDMVGQILGFLPKLFGAGIVFAVFFLVARIVQRLATNLLAGFGFDRLPQALGLPETPGGAAASTVAGYIVLIVLMSMGAVQAFKTLGLEIVSSLAEELLAGFFNILVACAIFAVGLFISRLAYRAIAAGEEGQAGLMANVARAGILIFTGAMALFRAGLAQEIVTLAFGALIVGVAIAGGVAFGLGGREEAARVIAGWRERS